jgi:hypothetical protein
MDPLDMPKEKVVHKDPTKQAFASILEFITNTFYRTDENNEITVQISDKSKGDNFYDRSRIVLSEKLIDEFGKLNLPRFTVYYHELAHHLYSQGEFILMEKWQKMNNGGPIEYHERYDHLANWLEDFYVEKMLLKEHSYLTDVLTCIKKLPPSYPIDKLEYAFNFYYTHGAPSPALSYADQVTFLNYINNLEALRSKTTTRFGHGILSTLSVKKSTETKYVEGLIKFYEWCVLKKILPKDNPLPPMSNPNNHAAPQSGQQGQQQGQQPGGAGGTHDAHSGKVGKNITYVERMHVSSPTQLFKDEVAGEAKMIQKELLDMSQRLQADTSTLDGLFATKHKDSPIIQPKIILPNFFNPQRLIDQVLFRQKQHTYMNVAIYRDISGSTTGTIHQLMEHVCAKLHVEIPVDITYYLYSSGKISIVEVPYVPWENSSKVPSIYQSNPLYKQLNGGTNSDAIADVITQQLSSKWLNIIITDGDLHALMRRDNIKALLANVFVVSVHAPVEDGLLGVEVNDITDIAKITPVLSTINLDRTV